MQRAGLTEDQWLCLIGSSPEEARTVLRRYLQPIFHKAGLSDSQAEEILDAVLPLLREFGVRRIMHWHSW